MWQSYTETDTGVFKRNQNQTRSIRSHLEASGSSRKRQTRQGDQPRLGGQALQGEQTRQGDQAQGAQAQLGGQAGQRGLAGYCILR